jgi:hypothetical protein
MEKRHDSIRSSVSAILLPLLLMGIGDWFWRYNATNAHQATTSAMEVQPTNPQVSDTAVIAQTPLAAQPLGTAKAKNGSKMVKKSLVIAPIRPEPDTQLRGGGFDRYPSMEDFSPPDCDLGPSPTIPNRDSVYETFHLEELPSFPGGEVELHKYLRDNIRYPALAYEQCINFTVALSFVVSKDGSISGITILKDPGGGCGKEAVRVVSEMPSWLPGEVNGRPVATRFIIPIRIRLE